MVVVAAKEDQRLKLTNKILALLPNRHSFEDDNPESIMVKK